MKFPGYVALITVIIVSSVLAILAGLLSYRSFRLRSDELVGRAKVQSRAAAEGCLEHALLALSLNNTYAGSESVTLSPSQSCDVVSVTTSGNNKIIKVTATTNASVTHFVLTVTGSTLQQISLEEVASL
jgi:hypothetical protein